MRIKRDRNLGTISVDQQTYIEQIIKRFNMHKSNLVKTPLDTNVKQSNDQEAKTKEEKREMSKMPYREALGSPMHAKIRNRTSPIQLAFSVNLVRIQEYLSGAH